MIRCFGSFGAGPAGIATPWGAGCCRAEQRCPSSTVGLLAAGLEQCNRSMHPVLKPWTVAPPHLSARLSRRHGAPPPCCQARCSWRAQRCLPSTVGHAAQHRPRRTGASGEGLPPPWGYGPSNLTCNVNLSFQARGELCCRWTPLP